MLAEPDIVILEGLNVLQTGVSAGADARFVSDWFDFSIYVDADEADIEQWYVDRFFALRETAFSDETSFFRHFAALVRRRAGGDRPAASGRASTARTSARTSSPAACGPTSCSRRPRTTACGGSASGSSSGPRDRHRPREDGCHA